VSRKAYCFAKKIISDGSMAGNLTSSTLGTTNLDNIGLIVSWAGTSPVGTLTVEVRQNSLGVTSEWSEIDFGAAISVTGDAGTHNININQTPYDELQVKFTRASGTGTLQVVAAGKSVG